MQKYSYYFFFFSCGDLKFTMVIPLWCKSVIYIYITLGLADKNASINISSHSCTVCLGFEH